ncbi:MarR family transcriptional regulator [uncultured Roseibium sp.]|uniref:MarR family winged helix-turn-helix transcriptional regulator n=1 Tax=uncultured Roseibium sp. TaxID=1936171 RepID=UPI002619B940|nr:MarR family transcriptional regulator [uncultured Roseibium sp.]
MVEDVVRVLGYSTLGSRLKRIGEKLQAQTQGIGMHLAGAELPASHNPVLAALDRNGPLSIGHLAEAVGQSQPGVTRMVNSLKASGLVEGRQDVTDRRINRIALTNKGAALVRQLQDTFWPRIMIAVKDACSELEGSLLQQLSQLEDALEDVPLKKRCAKDDIPDWAALMKQMETDR